MPAVVVAERCIGCKICDNRCPLDVFTMVPLDEPKKILGRRAKAMAVVSYPDECWNCGVCRLDCPTDAIRFVFPQDMLHLQWSPDGMLKNGSIKETALAAQQEQ